MAVSTIFFESMQYRKIKRDEQPIRISDSRKNIDLIEKLQDIMRIEVVLLFAIVHCVWINVGAGLPDTDGEFEQNSIFELITGVSFLFYFDSVQQTHKKCVMPQILRGSWFSIEHGQPTKTVIDDVSMSERGECESFVRDGAYYTFVLKSLTENCYYCVKTYPRSYNLFEKNESPCVTLEAGDEPPTVERICRDINDDQQLITLFNEDYIALNCQSSLQGAWQFAYQVGSISC